MIIMKINVGDYVRTKDGIIWKTKKIEEIEGKWFFDDYYWYDKEYIKSSPNIIDLIELGDIVELFEEDDVDREITGFYEVLAYTIDRKEIGVRNKDGEIDFYPAENLRGIITYEQIASMEYKIGGKDDE